MKLYVLKFIAFFAGALGCYVLQLYFGFTSVLAAALIGFAGSFLHFPKVYERKGLHSAIYAGSFAGMCSLELVQSSTEIIFLSSIGSFLYLASKPHGNGFGGKLGTISFLSSVIFFLAKSAW